MGKKKKEKAQQEYGPDAIKLPAVRQQLVPIVVRDADGNEVLIGHMPSVSSVSVADLRALRSAQKEDQRGEDGAFLDAFINIAYRYIRADVLDTMPLEQLGALADAWMGMGPVGES